MSAAKATIDPNKIRAWVEARGGRPAHVASTGSGGDPGILRVDFPGYSGRHTLEPIEWDAFFESFENNQLAFLYQDDEDSRFNKLVRRSSVEIPEQEREGAVRSEGRSSGKGPNAIRLLEGQHREVEALFDRLMSTDDPAEREQVFNTLGDALAAHATIEEQIFYPKVYVEESADILTHSVEEHLEMKRILAQLMAMEVNDDAFIDMVEELQKCVDHHVEEEEDRLFDLVARLEVADLDELGRQMDELYHTLQEGEPRWNVPDETGAPAPL